MGFVETIASFPTVIFTVLLGASMVYWLFAIIGAVDLDHGADGALDGAGHFHGDGHLHGDGVLDAAADASHGFDFMSALRLRRVPLTVVISLFSLFGWVLSSIFTSTFGESVAGLGLLASLPTLLGVSFVSLLMTSIAARPMGRLFVTHKAKSNKDLIGRVVVISTGSVTGRTGQATLEDGGAGLILQVRGDNSSLKRGDRALIIGYDETTEGFAIEPMRGLLSLDEKVTATPQDAELMAEAEAEAEAALQERPVAKRTAN